MEFVRQNIPDIFLIKPTVSTDKRGNFSETFRQDLFDQAVGREIRFIQDNESTSYKGVLRGLHYQSPPFEQSKLVRVLDGEVLDVAVDIRSSSPTYGKHVAVKLTSKNKNQLFIPSGCAHGFIVLSDIAVFSYKVDNYFSLENDYGISANDDNLNIDWILPLEDRLQSKKDILLPMLANLKTPF